MSGWTTYSLYEGKVTFLGGKMGDNEIYVGFGRGADVSFLDKDYDAVCGPAWSEEDGMYWGAYQKKGFVPEFTSEDCPEGYPVAEPLETAFLGLSLNEEETEEVPAHIIYGMRDDDEVAGVFDDEPAYLAMPVNNYALDHAYTEGGALDTSDLGYFESGWSVLPPEEEVDINVHAPDGWLYVCA